MALAVEGAASPETQPAETVSRQGARLSERARRGLLTAACSVALFILILLPRLSQLDALVTPDEPLWLARSANFYQALETGHFADTYQFVHPGVPVMWLGALGYVLHIPDLPDLMGGQIDDRNRDLQTILTTHGHPMVDTLVELRQVMVVATAFVVVAIFLILVQLIGLWAAAGAVTFLIFDPLHIGFTRLLHVDGLSANLLVLALVAFTWYQRRHSRVALIVSALSTGIAILTRSANGVLIPFFGLLALSELALAWRTDPSQLRPALRRYLIHGSVWAALVGIVFVLCWPAMWVNPISTLHDMWQGGADLASGGAELNQFFRGSAGKADPGWTYYPVVLAYRLSPFTMVGLLLAGVAAWRPRGFGASFDRRLGANLVAFAGSYDLILSFSAKKFDRYALPSILTLDVVAALGWIAGAIWLGRFFHGTDRRFAAGVPVGLVLVMLLGQADLGLRARPFYIDAASPLLGGTAGAQDVFSFDWGEGGKETAEALETIDGIESAYVVIGPWQTTTDYYLPFQLHEPVTTPNLRGAAAWLTTDYVVVTYPEVQRQLYPQALLDWFDQHQPVATVMDDVGVYARIYDIRNEPVPEAFYSGGIVASRWGDVATIVAADFPNSARAGHSIKVTLYFQAPGAPTRINVEAQVLAPDGTVVGTAVPTTVPVEIAASGVTLTAIRVPIDANAQPGRYSIRVTVYDAMTGAALAASDASTGEALQAPVRVGTFALKP